MALGALYQSLRGISTDISDTWNRQAQLDEDRREADQLQGYRTEQLGVQRASDAWTQAYQGGLLKSQRERDEIARVEAETAKARETRLGRESSSMEPNRIRYERALNAANRADQTWDDDRLERHFQSYGFRGGLEEVAAVTRTHGKEWASPPDWTPPPMPRVSGAQLEGPDETTRRQILLGALNEVDSVIAEASEQANLPENRSRRDQILQEGNRRAAGIANRRGFGTLQELRAAASTVNQLSGLTGPATEPAEGLPRLEGPGGVGGDTADRPPLEQRVRELRAQGVDREEARRILRREGYDIDGGAG